MDVFIPSRQTTPADEQNRLATGRNPGSLPRAWQNAKPLHELALRGRVNAGQFGSRLQRMDSLGQKPMLQSRDMFPFRIFVVPSIDQANPGWTDANGPAAWRTFQVWTGQAIAYQIFEAGSGAPGGMQIAVPQIVYVARTSGYNNAGLASQTGNAPSNATLNATIVGENWNEQFQASQLGNYPDNPGNPNGTGPTYVNPYDECVFTAPPSSIAVFWVSWDTNNSTGPDEYDLTLMEQSFAAFPVLHFGWYTAGGQYGGDLDDTNGPDILGFLASDYAGSPSQLYPYIPADALASPFNTGTQTPEGTAIIGAVQVGALGAVYDTSNDGILQIFQNQFNSMLSPMRQTQFRGTYSSSDWYYPNEIVAENSTTYLNATPFALQNYDPAANQSGAPLTDGVDYTNFTNLWMPLGGGGSGTTKMTIVSVSDNYLLCSPPSGANVNVAKPYYLRRSTYDGVAAPYPGTGTLNFVSATNSSGTYIEIRGESGGATQHELIFPPYTVGNPITASQPAGGTGVTAGGNAVTWLDLNIDYRAWAVQMETNEAGSCEYRAFVASAPYSSAF